MYNGALDDKKARRNRPTVCLDVTSMVVYSYGYNGDKIVQLVAHELAVHMAIHGEGMLNVHNTAIRSTLSPSRTCGNDTAGVHG